jgi:pyocin large subunit-like protein
MRALFPVWFLGLAMFFGGVASPLQAAVQIADGPKVEAQDTSAVLRWTTDIACGSHVKVGISANALTRKAEAEGVGTDHAVTVTDLQPATTYYFSVGTARVSLATGSFTTSGKGAKPTPVTEAPKDKGKRDASAKPSTPITASAPKVPPLSKIWGNPSSLPDHFARHGGDFGASSPEEYARMAWLFLQRATAEGLPAKYDESDDTIRVWDPKSRTFAAYHRDGRAKTFFKPDSRGYFDRQPGKSVKLSQK